MRKTFVYIVCFLLALGMVACKKKRDEPEVVITTGILYGHEYVDMGLSVKWASCNVGASSAEGYGDYFAWGETATKIDYSWATYQYGANAYSLTKYCTDTIFGALDNKTTLDATDDAVQTHWGGTWRLPTCKEWDELWRNCQWTWCEQNGVRGYEVTSYRNGAQLFLPAAGVYMGESAYREGTYGHYWSSSLYEATPSLASGMFFCETNHFTDCFDRRCGHPIRSVIR